VSLTGSVDEPAEDGTVRGTLVVRGWARIPGEDLSVTVLVDGEARSVLASERHARPDVAAAVPGIGDCAGAGWAVRIAFDPSDDGAHEVVAVFHAKDGRERRYAPRRFVWKP
jgi:hypothetical protein